MSRPLLDPTRKATSPELRARLDSLRDTIMKQLGLSMMEANWVMLSVLTEQSIVGMASDFLDTVPTMRKRRNP